MTYVAKGIPVTNAAHPDSAAVFKKLLRPDWMSLRTEGGLLMGGTFTCSMPILFFSEGYGNRRYAYPLSNQEINELFVPK